MNRSKYEIIEDAILNLEVVICRELDVDLDHPAIIHTERLRVEIDALQVADDLKAWQDGRLVNRDAINKLSLAELQKVSKVLEGIK